MGFPSYKNFDISFIQRTLDILGNYKGEYDFTMLMNSVLGLLILPNEYNAKNVRSFTFEYLNKNISEFKVLKEIFTDKEVELENEEAEVIKIKKFYWKSNSGKEIPPSEIELSKLLKRIRNGFAHFGVIPTKEGNYWDGVLIRNYPEPNSTYNMQVYLKKDELLCFGKFIAEKYIATVDKSQSKMLNINE